jgi:hypothetical protein
VDGKKESCPPAGDKIHSSNYTFWVKRKMGSASEIGHRISDIRHQLF